MVRGLVRRQLLRALSGTKSARAWERQAPCFARGLVAAPYKGYAYGSAVEHSAGVQVCRLWFPDCAGIGAKNTAPSAALRIEVGPASRKKMSLAGRGRGHARMPDAPRLYGTLTDRGALLCG